MSFEINPVLAGKFDAPDYASTNNLAQTTGTDEVTGPDPRRYTQFDRSATEAGSTTNFSFSDLVDMINPLEHIPVVSSVYRAIVGEDINPVSRVAGDILYGGVLGAASAVFSGVSAVADAGLESQTGKDSGGLAIAALFGPDDDKKAPVQLADTGTSATGATPAVNSPSPATKTIELAQSATGTPLLAALAVPSNAPASATAPVPSPADTSSSDITASNAVMPNTPTASSAGPAASNPAAMPAALQSSSAMGASTASPVTTGADSNPADLGAIPLAKSPTPGKQAYGGIMSPASTEAQNMAIALAQGSPGVRMGHTIYTNKIVNGSHSMPPRLSSGGAGLKLLAPVVAPTPVLPAAFAVPSSPSAAANISSTGQTLTAASTAPTIPQGNALSSTLLQDMMLKALNQYGNVASGPGASPGSMVNLVN